MGSPACEMGPPVRTAIQFALGGPRVPGGRHARAAHVHVDGELANLLTASDLVRPNIQTVTPENQLAEALESFRQYDGERLPVINNPQDRSLVGSISKNDLLLAAAEKLKSQKT
jgi:predicted transcriptional regulator